jgi:hypothetical protein
MSMWLNEYSAPELRDRIEHHTPNVDTVALAVKVDTRDYDGWEVHVFLAAEYDADPTAPPRVILRQRSLTGAVRTKDGQDIPDLAELALLLLAPRDEQGQMIGHLRNVEAHAVLLGPAGPTSRGRFSPLPSAMRPVPLEWLRAVHAAHHLGADLGHPDTDLSIPPDPWGPMGQPIPPPPGRRPWENAGGTAIFGDRLAASSVFGFGPGDIPPPVGGDRPEPGAHATLVTTAPDGTVTTRPLGRLPNGAFSFPPNYTPGPGESCEITFTERLG